MTTSIKVEEKIEKINDVVRELKVILDCDLAQLYGVETRIIKGFDNL